MDKADIVRHGQGIRDADLIPARRLWWNKHRLKILFALCLGVPFGYITTKSHLLGTGLRVHLTRFDLVLAVLMPVFFAVALAAQRYIFDTQRRSSKPKGYLVDAMIYLMCLVMAILLAGQIFFEWDIN